MTPEQFVSKWKASAKDERRDSHSHFNDLCALLGVDKPADADPMHDWFCFERGAKKTSGGSGWSDVWRKDCFGWEYKGVGGDLDAAYRQLLNYSDALQSPPLLIVSDMDRIRIHTSWTNTVQEIHTIRLDDLIDAAHRDRLRHCFLNPEALKPQKTRALLTEEAAEKFAAIANRLRGRGHDPQRVAHFVNRLVFCMFAEDVRLLPDKLFERTIKAARTDPDTLQARARSLFAAMRKGTLFGPDQLERFNGGLFDSDDALPLTWQDLDDLIRATALDWSDIDPSILGTLFERGLDPDKRSQLGAHYTDRDKIMMIVNPVIVTPLLAEWAAVKAEITALLARAVPTGRMGTTDAATRKAIRLKDAFKDRLRAFRILDPACGSGNFLYLALAELKTIEKSVNIDAEALGIGLAREVPLTGPDNVLGIELNPYAAELARVSVWIGDIQWSRRNGFEPARNPILRTLDTIECRDAVLGADGGRAEWPRADVVVGNPPFLGGKIMRSGRPATKKRPAQKGLGDEYVDRLFVAYNGNVRRESDFVCYWFAKTWDQVQAGTVARAGLVATNSIRGGANRTILKRIVLNGRIFEARSDEKWTVDGAAVRVSLVCFKKESLGGATLDGNLVAEIFPDLTARRTDGAGLDLTKSVRLAPNRDAAFMGDTKGGAFDVSGETARNWLSQPLNPNGRTNSEVLRPWVNGMDLTRRPSGKWIIDFGWKMSEGDAALYERPFAHVLLNVQPKRARNKREAYRKYWWQHVEARQGMWSRLNALQRFIVTPTVAKHRMFGWMSHPTCPDHQLIAIARDDDTTFGILHSRFHELWSLRMGTSLEDRPRYTPSTTFETFPFPDGLTPDIPAAAYAADPRAIAIAAAAADLNAKRERWLNPDDLVRRVPEVVPGYPDRLLPRDDRAAAELKKRTLTNLYNTRPQWLTHAHGQLDAAVAAAYGWADDWRAGKLTDDEILSRLFRLNQQRAGIT